MNSDTGALIFIVVLWSLFFVGVYRVARDKRRDKGGEWGTDKAGRRQ